MEYAAARFGGCCVFDEKCVVTKFGHFMVEISNYGFGLSQVCQVRVIVTDFDELMPVFFQDVVLKVYSIVAAATYRRCPKYKIRVDSCVFFFRVASGYDFCDVSDLAV